MCQILSVRINVMKSLIELVKKILFIPNESSNVEKWKIFFLSLVRLFVLFVGIVTTISGEWELGIMTLTLALAATVPAIFTREEVKDFPIEIEIMLFVIIVIQYILGEILGLYYTLPYFDKFAHFSMSLLIAAICYTILYAQYLTGRFVASRKMIFFLIILIVMGVGGIWEIIEYGIEFLRKNYFHEWVVFQGSLVEDPYYDTMNDLVFDFLGAIGGAIFSLKFILSNIKHPRTQELVSDIEQRILD